MEFHGVHTISIDFGAIRTWSLKDLEISTFLFVCSDLHFFPGYLIPAAPLQKDYTLFHPTRERKYMSSSRHLQRLLKRITKDVGAEQRQDAEHHGDGLLSAEGAGDGGAAEDDGGEQGELQTVRLEVLETVAAQSVWKRRGRPC